MLKDVLTDQEKIILNPKIKNALINFVPIINDMKPKEKHQFIIPLKNSGFSLKESHSFGFKITKYMWNNCNNLEKREKGFY